MTREDFALKKFADIMKDCREKMIHDVLNGNNDLYHYLLCDRNLKVLDLYRRRYELKWLALHWQKSRELIEAKDIPLSTRHELLKIFLQIHQEFIAEWGYSPMDGFFIDAQIESFDMLISTDQKWQEMLEGIQLSILKKNKEIEKQIKEAEIL